MTENQYEFSNELAEEVTRDFLRRQEERRLIERGWELNMNFLCGNQYCGINSSGELFEEDKRYFWQNRRVFNHIAPTMDMRCAKLGRLRPALSVRAASDEEADRHSAALSSAILSYASDECDLDGVIADATLWSEVCGTSFYKIVWDGTAGVCLAGDGAAQIRSGDVRIAALSPFEIYPYSLSEEKLENQPSIIHARAMHVKDIAAAYGVEIAGRDIEEFSLAPYAECVHWGDGSKVKRIRHGYEVVIERYSRPDCKNPKGKLTVVAGGKLLYDGELPYENGREGGRSYPFVKQTSLQVAGGFFGGSVVDRLIPVQRAYNAVKNRKHEFLNRLSMGTVAVEDGSVDVDELAEEGLTPGKVIVYRQGGKPPESLMLGAVPDAFEKEEENLLGEFFKISGTGELSQQTDAFAGVTSATGLQLIIEQDEARLTGTYQQIKRAVREVGRHILRLYRQFATEGRLLKRGASDLGIFYFKGGDLSSDDVVLDADSDANMTPAQKRTVIYEIIDRGLLGDEGKLSGAQKNKVLEMLGYAALADGRDLRGLHAARAGEENVAMLTGEVQIKQYDDHAAHIEEHTAFLLTEKLTKEVEERITAHLEEHRKKLSEVVNG